MPAPCLACPLRILLAEDNVTNRMLASRLLEKFGMLVESADNGLEAVALWGKEQLPRDT